MTDHIAVRETVLRSLSEELVGPCPKGDEIDCTGSGKLILATHSYGPWKQKGSGEEILHRDRPTKRYGVAVLYPMATLAVEDEERGAESEPIDSNESDSVIGEQASESLAEIQARRDDRQRDSDPYDLDLSGANNYRPSTLAISFLADISEGSQLEVHVTGGRYREKIVQMPLSSKSLVDEAGAENENTSSENRNSERSWWLRSPITLISTFDSRSIRNADSAALRADTSEATNTEGLALSIELVVRKQVHPDQFLITVCLVNRHEDCDAPDSYCLFQSSFKAFVKVGPATGLILPYPGSAVCELDEEEKSFAMLGRDTPTYAVGHGCAADWQSNADARTASCVFARCLPTHELPSYTPDITKSDGSQLRVPMAPLAGLVANDDGISSLQEVINQYQNWIASERDRIGTLEQVHQDTAKLHLDRCEKCAQRMASGLSFLQTDTQAFRAFQLANRAVLMQQLRTHERNARTTEYDSNSMRITFSEPYTALNLDNIPEGRGSWRAFQIAFFLLSVQSTAMPGSEDRENVELIWFPTGGGKTEAYSALAAYSMFLRRLRDNDDRGVDVLMRYTLRLLTAQQFQRASALICAMEYIRRTSNGDLGDHEFSIGIWVGGENTPNSRRDALSDLRKINRGERWIQNRFLVTRCPWCRAQIGPIKYKGFRPKKAPVQVGYEQRGSAVAITCPDVDCEFEKGLPIYVVDEDIYEQRPTLVIGTVDKFAMLAWRQEARSLFGLAIDGERDASPPTLIIQDELHLISGPLGSMSGLYETVVEELATDRRCEPVALPKIVCSTATIRRYGDQIKALYGRVDEKGNPRVTLFPPPGLDAGDSFFAVHATDSNGNFLPGRMYVGVHGAGLGSLQTAQVRTFTALLQSPMELDDVEKDPWWTLLVFFNSLRELGTTLSLFQSDIDNYFRVLLNRLGIDWPKLRRINYIRELTGRLPNDEIPKAITQLEAAVKKGTSGVVDVCLASNIIEVGIDIDRLSLMAVVGQPKTTSQYIQVTGRVGRKWRERPGLVVTIYSPSKPRDRSHFEKFRSYHEQLDAQVEPTSVTPFSPPALDRALHAVIVAYVRQFASTDEITRPIPYPADLIEGLRSILVNRVRAIDPDEAVNFERVFDMRADEWRRWERTRWSPYNNTESQSDAPLLHSAGSYIPRDWSRISWPTPTSLRNVDAECQAEVTLQYIDDEEVSNA